MSDHPPSSNRQDPTVPRQYEKWAQIYDVLWHRYMEKTLPVLQRTADPAPGERVLDLGSGTGELEQRIHASTPEVEIVGIDLAQSMVETARKKLAGTEGISFLLADAHDLPFPNESFDVVVTASTFHYFTLPQQVLHEVARVLRPSGRLVLLDWCRDFWTCRVMDTVLQWIDPAHRRCFTLEEITSQIGASPLTYRFGFRYRFDVVWGMMVVEAGA